MNVGFTGTQQGMTKRQMEAFITLLSNYIEVNEFHHGDCIGADNEAHDLIKEHRIYKKIVIHPPSNPDKRAFCKARTIREPKSYLERNHDIVDETDMLIATPKEWREQLRSGTWATIRYARKKGKRVIIIYPDGSVNRGSV